MPKLLLWILLIMGVGIVTTACAPAANPPIESPASPSPSPSPSK